MVKNVEPKLEVVKPKEEVPVESMSIEKPKSKFDINKFKSKRAPTIANVQTMVTALPHHKISDANDFVRLHDNEETHWTDELCFVAVPVKGQKNPVVHLITEELAAQLPRRRLALGCKPAPGQDRRSDGWQLRVRAKLLTLIP